MPRMPALRVGQRQPVHELRELPIGLRPQHQVPMSGHDDEVKQAHRAGSLGFCQDTDERIVVCGISKQRRPPTRPVEDMVYDSRRSAPMTSRHGGGKLARTVPATQMAKTANDSRPLLAVLISGRGSNLQAIIDAVAARTLDATVAVVISDRVDAPGLARARAAHIDAIAVDARGFASRDAFDRAVVDLLRAREVGLVCLAGFMRRVGPALLAAFPDRTLNIHPSLLPAFPGLDAQRQALDHGVRITGATVHLVTPDLDAGPIVMQAAVPVLEVDTVDTLAARILVEEHRIYPEAIRLVLNGGWRLDGRRFVTGS